MVNLSLLLALKQCQANKKQSLMMILLILVSSGLLAISFGLLFNQNQPLNVLSNRSGPELNLVFSGNHYQVDSLANWWRDTTGIQYVETTPTLPGGEVSINNLTPPIYLSLAAKQQTSQLIDRQETPVPLPGQVWVPASLAEAENIQLGDYLVTKANQQKFILEVSAIIVDPYSSESTNAFKRIWLNQKDFDKFLLPNDESYYTLSIKFNNFAADDKKIWQAFSESLATSFSGSQLTLKEVAKTYQSSFIFTAKNFFCAALIVTLLTSYLIFFKLNYAILTQSNQLALYRRLGFSTWQLRLIYLFQFSLTGIIGILLGLSLSIVPLRKLCLHLLRNLSLEKINLTIIWPFSLSVIMIALVISLSVLLATRKIKKLAPVQALTSDPLTLSQKNKQRHSLFKKNKLNLNLALPWQNSPSWRGSSWALVLSSTLLAFICCLSLNLINSFDKMVENRAFWGYHEGDLLLKLKEPDKSESVHDILAYLRKEPSINSIVALNYYPKVVLETAQGNTSDVKAMGFFGSLEKIGQTNLDGRHPLHESEISLGQTTAKKLNKKIGDTLTLSINAQLSTFKITGIYQSLVNGGAGIRLADKNILDADPYFSRSDYYLKTNTKQLTNVIKKIESQFPKHISLVKVNELVQGDVAPLTAKVKLVLSVFSGIAVALFIVFVFTSLTLTIEKDRAHLSFLKMNGSSHWELLKIQLIKLFLLTTIGSVLGITLALIFSKRLLAYFFTEVGISQLPLVIDLTKTSLVIPLCFLSLLLGAIIPLSKIKKIKPLEIINE